MLKISIIDGPTRRLLIVEGKLIAPWVAELRSACEKARADLCGHEFVLEMKYITTISQGGENLIIELINAGIKIRCRGIFTKHIMKELTRSASTPRQPQAGNRGQLRLPISSSRWFYGTSESEPQRWQ